MSNTPVPTQELIDNLAEQTTHEIMEIDSLTFERYHYDQFAPAVTVSYMEHGANCGDKARKTYVEISKEEAGKIIKFLQKAFP